LSESSTSSLLKAADRKVRIAGFHCEQLEHYLRCEPRTKCVPISIQAHFEGIVVSVIAAIDQVAQAVNSALSLHAKPHELTVKAFSAISELSVVEWFNDPIGQDLRSIRVRIVHYSYTKDFLGVDFKIEEARKPYPGSRDLLIYSREAVGYAERLRKFIPLIKERIKRGEAGSD
jgi:hypothetical protein